MKSSANDLAKKLRQVHADFDLTGNDLIQILDSFQKLGVERNLLLNALENVLFCRNMSVLMVQTRNEIVQNDYFAALKTIKTLQQKNGVNKNSALFQSLNNFVAEQLEILVTAAKADMQEMLIQSRAERSALGKAILLR